MNILFIHCIRKEKFGGGEKWLVAAAAGLAERGHNVTIGGRPGSKLFSAAAEAGVKTADINIFSDISIYHIFKVYRFLRKHKTDVLITRSTDLTVAGLAAAITRRRIGKPVVIVRHGLPMIYAIRKHVFLLNRLAQGIITNTNSIKEEYERKKFFPPGFTKVIHNGISPADDGGAVDFGGRFPGKRIILSAGRLAYQKGYSYLADAIALLPPAYDDLVFVILGAGKQHGKLLAYAKKKAVLQRMHFEGFVENVHPYLRACEFFVLPSLYEGMPNAAMEAMAASKAVILTKVNGTPELIRNPSLGLLVAPENPKELADAIIKLADNKELRNEMGKNAAKHMHENFAMNTMIDNIQAFLKEKLTTYTSRQPEKKIHP